MQIDSEKGLEPVPIKRGVKSKCDYFPGLISKIRNDWKIYKKMPKGKKAKPYTYSKNI